MNFYLVYIVIPIILFLLRPKRDNKLLFFYWIFVVVFSYDNVTDFYNYSDQFTDLLYNTERESSRGTTEFLWTFFFRMFTFTEYGAVMMHILVMILVVAAFSFWSKKFNILNYSILLYFILNLVWKHDNVLRQDVAMVFAYICFFKALLSPKISIKLCLEILALAVVAFFFHYSAILIVPYCFFIRWLSKTNVRLGLVFVFVVVFVTICQLEMVSDLFRQGAIFLTFLEGDTAEYYLIKLQELEMTSGGRLGILISIFSLVPAFYFKFYSKERYKNDVLLRVSVHLSWISVVWSSAVAFELLVRPLDYFLWFEVWGIAYFLDDVSKKIRKRFPFAMIGLLYLAMFIYCEVAFVNRYYGDNKYMTVFTKECKELRLYDREKTVNGEIDYSYKRVR